MEIEVLDIDRLIFSIKRGRKRKGVRVQIVSSPFTDCRGCILYKVCNEGPPDLCLHLIYEAVNIKLSLRIPTLRKICRRD